MRSKAVCASVLLGGLPGCAPGPLDDYWPQASSLAHDVEAVHVPRDPSSQREGQATIEEPRGQLELAKALSLALLKNPDLVVFAWDIRAQEAAVLQAGLLPNPEVSVEIEDFGGSGVFSGFDASETTIAVGQTILLGSKRKRRIDLARTGRDLAGWDYEVARVEVITRVGFHFVDTLAAQQRLESARETAALAERVHSTIRQRVEAGRISPVERTKAGIDLAQAHVELQRAERELTAARHRLASTWGSVAPRFEAAVGDLSRIREPPPVESLTQRIEGNPDLARWATQMAMRRAAVALAKAEAIPDVTPFAGVKLLEGAHETAFVAGVSMPLAIFDRNQGGILGARIRSTQAQTLYHAAQVRVQTALAVAYQALDAAYHEVLIVQAEIAPSARSALEAAEEAFRQGKFGALDLLDAQRTLFAARRQSVDAQAAYHQAVIVVERLIGGPLHEPGGDVQ